MKSASQKIEAISTLKKRGILINTIIDVGVNYGTPELTIVYPDKLHALFEPVAEFSDKIEQFYKDIDHELHLMAISDEEGDVGLSVSAPAGGKEVTHSSVEIRNSSLQTRTVRRARLDTIVADRGYAPPYFLKIDVDGHELAVLAGAAQTLVNTSIIMIEVQKYELAERISTLNEAGFELFDLVESCYYDNSFWQCDAILIKKDLQRIFFRQLGENFDRSLYTVRT